MCVRELLHGKYVEQKFYLTWVLVSALLFSSFMLVHVWNMCFHINHWLQCWYMHSSLSKPKRESGKINTKFSHPYYKFTTCDLSKWRFLSEFYCKFFDESFDSSWRWIILNELTRTVVWLHHRKLCRDLESFRFQLVWYGGNCGHNRGHK